MYHCCKTSVFFAIGPRRRSRPPHLILAWILFFGCLHIWSANALALSNDPLLRQHLRDRIFSESAEQKFVCRSELICGIAELPRLYAQRDYQPVWVSSPAFDRLADSLIEAIRSVRGDGLNPFDYHLVNLEYLLDTIRGAQKDQRRISFKLLVDVELLLTDAFLLLGSHLLAGRVDPESIHTEWIVSSPNVNLSRIMLDGINARQIGPALNRLKPPHPGYAALRNALDRYRRIAADGGWPVLSASVSWRRGEYGARYADLRRRLELAGDLEPDHSALRVVFDRRIEFGLRRFQHRHGLKVTGRIDERTLDALNVSADQRVKQIELNLERWRWVPHEMGRRRIEVNIADFSLAVMEENREVMSMRVVVGGDYRKTPVFSRQMKYLVINPYWNIPQKLAYEDLLPRVRRNPVYLKRRNIKVFASWRRGAPEIDPLGIDWNAVNRENFIYKFRQEPGPYNDLGRLKFMFPNKFAVYLHDTPSKRAFFKAVRSFSSGCIRVEKPIQLAAYLLSRDPRWNRKTLKEAIRTNERQVVHLARKIPVHVLYRTAWVDGDGLLHFREDVYDRDGPLYMALNERPPRI